MDHGQERRRESSLVEKFLRPIRLGNEMLVLSGRCYDRESVPFKAIDSIIDSLVAFLRSAAGSKYCEQLPEDIQVLAQLFPLLRRVDAIAKAPTVDLSRLEPEKIRARGFYALRELLIVISHDIQVVVSIDDLQWADADSAEAWMELLTGANAPAVLFLGSYRSDEAEESLFLQTWQRQAASELRRIESREVGVESLTREQCIELAAIRTGADSRLIQKHADELFEDTGGNPYFLEQLIEGFDAETGGFRHVPLDEIIAERLQKLPETAGKLLNVIAISGQPISVDEATQVAARNTSELATLTHMRSERLVRLVGGLDRSMVDTYHDKIRETVVGGMPESQRKELHLELANAIEANQSLVADDLLKHLSASGTAEDRGETVSPRIFDLAHHFFEAGDPRAFQYQLAAGLVALDAFAMDEAKGYLRTAKTIEPGSLDRPIRFQLEYAFAYALWGTGAMETSRQHFTEAMQFAGSSFEKALCYAGRGNGLMKQGNLVDAGEEFYEVLELLGDPQPRSLFFKLAGIVAHSFRLFIVPTWLPRRRQTVNRDDQAERLMAVTRITIGYAFLTDLPALLHTAFKTFANAKFSKNVDTRVEHHAAATEFFWLNGMMALGQKYLKKTTSELSTTNSPSVIAAAKNHLGIACYYRGRFDESIRYFDESFSQQVKNRDWLLYQNYHIKRHLWSIRGNTKEILHWAQLEKELAEQTDDKVTYAYALYGLADAYTRRGECEKAITCAKESSRRLSASQTFLVTIAEQELGRALLQNADYERATQTLRTNVDYIRKSFLFMELNLDSYSLLVEAILGTKWMESSEHITRADRWSASRFARKARFHCTKFPTLRPHCFRVSGRACVANGRNRKATRYFDKAIASAKEIGADYEHARALIDKSLLDYPQSCEDRQQGLDLLESLGCVLPEAEVEYLGIDRQAHHARAAAARESEQD